MVMESGFSSPRAVESLFPAGLRVLVVDDDPTWLKILEKMLKKCNYDVTTCGLAREALRLLRERKDGFDIVISDVNMPDMDGFKLLEHVGLEMDLPVIMMSVDGETSRVMKGVQHGACDYLLKPIRMKELKNIWQHVFRKRMHEVRDIESQDSMDDLQLFRNAADFADDGHFFGGVDQAFLKKRKDNGDKGSNDPSATKKPRVVWSVDLHQKFVKAVNLIGFDKVGPKKILDLMNVPRLTRENVASHLQKYRLYLSRLQKENELKSGCGGLKNMDQSSKDTGVSLGVQNSSIANIRCPDYKLPVQSADAKPHETDPKGINLSPLAESRMSFHSDILDAHKATSSPKMGLERCLGSLNPEISYASFERPLPKQFAWSGEVKDSPYEFECKPHQQELLAIPFECKPHDRLEDCFSNQPTVHVPQPADCFNPGRLSAFERESLGIIDSKLLGAEIGNGIVEQPPLAGQTAGSLSQSETCALNAALFAANTFPNMTHQSISESAFGSWTDDLSNYPLQGDYFAIMGLDTIGFPDNSFPGLINEAPPVCFFGAPRYDFECPSDSMEYPVVDQGLSISSR